MKTRPVWLLPGWSRSFELKRFCMQAFVAGPLSAACAVYGNPVLMVVVFFVASWPFAYRARYTGEGVELSWLWVRECLRVADIRTARMRPRFRYLLLFRYEQALELELATGKRAVMVASPNTLELFHSELTRALVTRGQAIDSTNSATNPQRLVQRSTSGLRRPRE